MLYCLRCLLSFGHCNFLDLLVLSFLPIVGQLYGYTMTEYTSDPQRQCPVKLAAGNGLCVNFHFQFPSLENCWVSGSLYICSL